MKFLPFDSITFRTKLKESEVLARLKQNVGPNRIFEIRSDYSTPFRGRITGDRFVIKRKINYRNSFRPVIHGWIEDVFTETVIHVKMRLTIEVIIFMTIWFGAIGFACLCIILVALSDFKKANYSDVIPTFIICAMLIGGYLLTIMSFNAERKKAKEKLQEIFDAETSE